MSEAHAPLSALLRRFLRSAVFLNYAVTALRLAGFLAVTLLALRLLPTEQIGFWYVLTSLGGLLGLADLGLAPVISRRASFYTAGASSVPVQGLPSQPSPGTPPNLPALAALIRMARRFYLRLAAGIGLCVAVGGWFWLGKAHPEFVTQPVVQVAYVVFMLVNVAAVSGAFWPSLLYGVNEVRAHQAVFLAGLAANYVLVFAGLVAGLGLMALVLGQICLAWLPRWLARRRFLAVLPIPNPGPIPAEPMARAWPMAWRTGGITLAAWLCLQSGTLVCAQFLGLETTASYSLSLQFAVLCHGMGGAWLSVKLPEIAQLRAHGRTGEALELVRHRMMACMGTYALAALMVWLAAPELLRLTGSGTRLLPPALLGALLLMVGLDAWVGMHSAVLQTSNRAPHLCRYLISGVTGLLVALVLTPRLGVMGLILAPVLAQMPVNYWWIPVRCWRELRAGETP